MRRRDGEEVYFSPSARITVIGIMSSGLEPTFEGDFTFADDAPFRLEAGGELRGVTLRYALYGN